MGQEGSSMPPAAKEILVLRSVPGHLILSDYATLSDQNHDSIKQSRRWRLRFTGWTQYILY